MFGALGGILPLRLGGTAENGWTAAQHARFSADIIATTRVLPLASWTFAKSGSTVTVSNYVGRNGVGPAHAPAGSSGGTGIAVFVFSASQWEDVYEAGRNILPVFRGLDVDVVGSTEWAYGYLTKPLELTVETIASIALPDLADGSASVELFGNWDNIQARGIGDYGGDPNKRDSDTEGALPYAAAILDQLQQDRGSAYTTTPGRLVDAENMALARFLAATGPRTAEKLRANAVPGTSDERLDYWQRFLAVPVRAGEPKWRRRQKLATHYRSTQGPTSEEVRGQLEELLGDAFVDMSWQTGSSLSSPPSPTRWPDIDPGAADASLGGGAWFSARCHLFVEVQIPAGMSEGAFMTLMRVDFQSLLDRLLPAWATFDWATSDGFIVGESLVGFDGI